MLYPPLDKCIPLWYTYRQNQKKETEMFENLIPAARPQTETDRIRAERIAKELAEYEAEKARQMAEWEAMTPAERAAWERKARQSWIGAEPWETR